LTIGTAENGPTLLARISRRAYQVLGFSRGQAVYAQVKAVRLIEHGHSGLTMPTQKQRLADEDILNIEGANHGNHREKPAQR
jgi:hypothetical protein